MISRDVKRLKKRLRDFLPDLPEKDRSEISNSYDIIGEIAIIRYSPLAEKYGPNVAEAMMKIHPNIRSVFAQNGAVQGNFRLRMLKQLSGEKRTFTVHKESGCAFQVDVEKCYFSPRLLNERMRIARLVQDGEIVVNMFAGVGCFSIIIARHSNPVKVYSIDINPDAVRYMKENVRINSCFGKVIPLSGDAKRVIEENLQGSADRVIMPLPEKALEYLPAALSALRDRRGWIHYQGFTHARKEDSVEKAKQRVYEKLKEIDTDFNIPFGRVVRTTGPNWYQIALDIRTT